MRTGYFVGTDIQFSLHAMLREAESVQFLCVQSATGGWQGRRRNPSGRWCYDFDIRPTSGPRYDEIARFFRVHLATLNRPVMEQELMLPCLEEVSREPR